MKHAFLLRKCPLFHQIGDEDLTALLDCLGAREKRYTKGAVIFAEGEEARALGIVLAGAVQIVRLDYDGNRRILTSIEPPQLFGESFACAGVTSLPVDVVAAEDTEVLLIDARHITQSCNRACAFHRQLIFNLLSIVARKNLVFHQKIEITSKRSTREKLMTYLLLQAKKAKNRTFTIPFDRQALADYLGVERSGLSAQISQLRREKVLECRKSTFTLLS